MATQPHVPSQADGSQADGSQAGGSQAGGPEDSGTAAPPALRIEPAASEACRLLCAGTYLNSSFRDRVIKELYAHDERLVAPSSGYDAARVLAHALRARRLELGWAGLILLLWIVAFALTGGVVLLLLVPVLVLTFGSYIRGSGPEAGAARRGLGLIVKGYGALTLLAAVVLLLAVVLPGDRSGSLLEIAIPLSNPFVLFAFIGADLSSMSAVGLAYVAHPLQAGIALVIPLVNVWLVGLQRGQFAWVMGRELSRARFPDAAADPAERAEGVRFRRLRDRIRTEQHGPLVMYGATDPFCGSGSPFKAWSLSVELNPRKDRTPEPMDNAAVLRRIRPFVEALRIPSVRGAAGAADGVRDRLRSLEIDECVFLPVEGLPDREAAPYAPEAFQEHWARAVEEGGETRRHFLRIRVGGWGEGLVVTVFVRVHTQGGLLMLEVVPHVLWPLYPLFQNADRAAHQHRNNSMVGKAVWALRHTPLSLGVAVATLWRGLTSLWELGSEGSRAALPDGPAVSIRELGSADAPSLFQTMDAERYLKSIQDRVAGGVQAALHDAGWQTAGFEQQIVNVGNGGVFIGSAQGAVGVGNNNTITQTGTTPEAGGTSGD